MFLCLYVVWHFESVLFCVVVFNFCFSNVLIFNRPTAQCKLNATKNHLCTFVNQNTEWLIKNLTFAVYITSLSLFRCRWYTWIISMLFCYDFCYIVLCHSNSQPILNWAQISFLTIKTTYLLTSTWCLMNDITYHYIQQQPKTGIIKHQWITSIDGIIFSGIF